MVDEGQNSFQIETANTTLFYQKQGAGFSSIVDGDGNDWVNHHPTGGSAGAFRGIPNLVFPEGHFHPGDSGSTSTIVSTGPLKATVHSETNDQLWEAIWEIYATYATMTVLKGDGTYWFLYEGTPGGVFETNVDTVVRPDGTATLASQSWSGDIVGDEWVYFLDPVVGRSLFVANHQDDTANDSYPAHTVANVLGSSVSDLDAGTLEGIAITTSTGNGTWQYSLDGANWSDVGAVSDNSSLLLRDTDQLRYIPDGSNGETATLTYRAWDQTVRRRRQQRRHHDQRWQHRLQ